jgi:hypothetical protein
VRTKLVKRYWCDFCNKAGLSAGAMSKHERHCTLNPNRQCRVCAMVADARRADWKPSTLAELVSLLPSKASLFQENDYHGDYFADTDGTLKAAIPVLREASGDCPACMMAAIRQAGIPVPLADGFDFSAEMKQIWADINQRQHQYDESA